MDGQAGREARALQLSSVSDAQKKAYEDLLKAIKDKTIATNIAKQANKGGPFGEEIVANDGGNQVNQDELEGQESCNGDGAFCTRRNAGNKNHFVYAAMGSRGYAFVTGREGGDTPIRNRLEQVIPQQDTIDILEDEGSAYFSSTQNHSRKPAENGAAWGDDHGQVSLTFNRGQAPCPRSSPSTPMGIDAHVKSNDLPNGEQDEHRWTGGQDPANRAQQHTMGNCTLCPGMWPPHADYNYKNVHQTNNNFGQPKNYAVIQRNYSDRFGGQADPWNLFFNFRFSSTAQEFDNRGIKLSTGTDISKATALSAGIAYYHHRTGEWTEPPNFLNPFWRATLISAWVDEAGRDDVSRALGASGAPFTREAYEALRDAGYAAW